MACNNYARRIKLLGIAGNCGPSQRIALFAPSKLKVAGSNPAGVAIFSMT
jgi:hypothetical protein